ncbi:hypothetical protein Egran_00752, partial [Elaphomyces granulatus]
MFHTIDLGSSAFRTLDRKQSLISNVSIIVSTSISSRQLSTNVEDILASRTTWIVNGPEIILDVSIQTNWVSPGPISRFADRVTDLLTHARLWSELGLVASAKTYEPTVSSDRITLKKLLLAIRDDINHSTENKTTNLPDSVRRRLVKDAEPPASIKVMLLHTIRVRLEFDSFDWRDGADLPIFSLSFKAFEDPAAGPSLSAEKRDIYAYRMFTNLPHEPINRFSVSDCVLRSRGEVLLAPGDSSSRKMGNLQSLGDVPVLDCGMDLEENGEFERLLDYAIRNLISSNPSRVAPGLKESSSGLVKHLSDIAPAAVLQRANFISTIAKSLASIVNSADSDLLRQKLTELSEFYMSNYEKDLEKFETPEDPDLRSVFKCLLWATAQDGLFNVNAARKLSPIYPT